MAARWISLFAGLAMAAPLTAAQPALPDPTRPPDYGVVELAELPKMIANWRLTGIKFAADQRLAILNDQVVSEGDSIGTARIVEIQPSGVVIEQDGKKLRVEILPHAVKRAASNDE